MGRYDHAFCVPTFMGQILKPRNVRSPYESGKILISLADVASKNYLHLKEL